jgi:hypothetical protein
MREWKNGSGGCIQQPTTTTREREGRRKVGHLSSYWRIYAPAFKSSFVIA